MDSKKRVRVWDKEGKYIGDFEVPIEFPPLVHFGNKFYEFNEIYAVYVELKQQPYQVPSLWNPQSKTPQ